MTTQFEKVVYFNTQYGVIAQDGILQSEMKPQNDVIEQHPDIVEKCLNLIREEMKELDKAVSDKDFTEMVDALADLIYVTHGMSCRVGVNMDQVFDLVHDNNMTKLCQTEEEAQESVQYYLDNKDVLGYDSPTYRKAPDDIHWVVYNQSANKVLKRKGYTKVDLASVCK